MPEITQNDAEQLQATINGIAKSMFEPFRTPVYWRPDEYGMEYEDVFFQAADGVALEGWFIPAGSNRLIICNHFMPANRSGYPGKVKPWLGFGENEANFLPRYKTLHDAGYNILAYDLRNHGMSGSSGGEFVGHGLVEYRDVIGSLRYARSRSDTANMEISLLSMCLGCNSTIVAMDKYPEEFQDVKSMIALQPISMRAILEAWCRQFGVTDVMDRFETAFRAVAGYKIDELSPIPHAKAVKIPTLVVQVHDDISTHPSDVQAIYDNISAKDKKLFWIEGTTQRIDGYVYFNENPDLMLEWFGKHMGM